MEDFFFIVVILVMFIFFLCFEKLRLILNLLDIGELYFGKR